MENMAIEHARTMASAFKKMGVNPNIYGVMAEYSTSKFSGRPELWEPLGAPNNCFENAGEIVLSMLGDYDYVEGFVISDNLAILIHHAWIVDNSTGDIYETTLDLNSTHRKGHNYHYAGIRMDYETYRHELNKWGYWGLFADDIRYNAELFQKILDKEI